MNDAAGGGMTTAPECEERTLQVLASSPFSAEASKRHGTRSKSGVTKPSLKIAGEADAEEEDAKPAPPKKKAPAPKKPAAVPRSESPSQGSSGSGSDGEEKNRMQGLLTALLLQCPEDAEGAKPKARKRKPSTGPRGGGSAKKAAIEVHDDDDDDGTKEEKAKLSAEERADLARTRNRQHARRTRHRAKQQARRAAAGSRART